MSRLIFLASLTLFGLSAFQACAAHSPEASSFTFISEDACAAYPMGDADLNGRLERTDFIFASGPSFAAAEHACPRVLDLDGNGSYTAEDLQQLDILTRE